MLQQAEETMKRIAASKGVVGTIVVNDKGLPITSTLDNATTLQYAGLMSQLADKARNAVRELDPGNDLTFMQIHSKKDEIMIAASGKKFKLIVIQDRTDNNPST